MKIISVLLNKGKRVLLPLGDYHRYDFVIDDNSNFIRVQCKTGRIRNDVLLFKTCSQHCRTHKHKGYKNEIDYLGVYCPELDKCYLVPVDSVPETEASLRLNIPKNKQQKDIKWAKDYEIA